MKTEVCNNISHKIFEMLEYSEMADIKGGKPWKKYKASVVPRGKDVFDPDEH